MKEIVDVNIIQRPWQIFWSNHFESLSSVLLVDPSLEEVVPQLEGAGLALLLGHREQLDDALKKKQ